MLGQLAGSFLNSIFGGNVDVVDVNVQYSPEGVFLGGSTIKGTDLQEAIWTDNDGQRHASLSGEGVVSLINILAGGQKESEIKITGGENSEGTEVVFSAPMSDGTAVLTEAEEGVQLDLKGPQGVPLSLELTEPYNATIDQNINVVTIIDANFKALASSYDPELIKALVLNNVPTMLPKMIAPIESKPFEVDAEVTAAITFAAPKVTPQVSQQVVEQTQQVTEQSKP